MNSNLRSLSRSFMSGIKSAESGATTLSTDKNVLYIMLIVAVVTVLGYLMMGNIEAVAFFVIVAYLSTFFTKNMVVVFLISILATNFLMVTKVRFSRKEGMENPDSPSATPSATPSAAPSSNPEPKPTNLKNPTKEGMNGKLAPANYNDQEDEDAPDKNKEIEKAHDNLQSIVGGRVNPAETDQIMQQQKILMDNMKTMQPFLETAERFLDKFNMKGIDGLLGKIGINGSGASA